MHQVIDSYIYLLWCFVPGNDPPRIVIPYPGLTYRRRYLVAGVNNSSMPPLNFAGTWGIYLPLRPSMGESNEFDLLSKHVGEIRPSCRGKA
jgi:hypothetical protein